jgi:hypothetical protein
MLTLDMGGSLKNGEKPPERFLSEQGNAVHRPFSPRFLQSGPVPKKPSSRTGSAGGNFDSAPQKPRPPGAGRACQRRVLPEF